MKYIGTYKKLIKLIDIENEDIRFCYCAVLLVEGEEE